VGAAIILSANETSPTAEDLLAHVRSNLSPQKSPEQWFQMEAFPLTASGKVQKFVLKQLNKDGKLAGIV